MSLAPDTSAQTTLPTSTSLPSSLWLRLGGVLASPRAALGALFDDPRAGPLAPLVVYVVAAVAGIAPELYRLAALRAVAPQIAWPRIGLAIANTVRGELAVVAGAALVVGGLVASLERTGARGAWRAAVATVHLVLPLAALKAVSVVVVAAGFDAWWLPHRAIDALPAIVVGGRVDLVRFGVKCAIAFGPGLVVLLLALVPRLRARGAPHAAVRPYVARNGFAALLVVVGAGVVGSVVFVQQHAAQLTPALAGTPLPALPLARLGPDPNRKGSRVDPLRMAQRDDVKVLVLDFWASWCTPCRRSVPELSEIARAYQARGVSVVGVNREPNDVDAAAAAWAELAPAFPSLIDDRGYGERLGLTSLPSSYVVDHRGVIRHVHLGYTDPAIVRAELDALLAEHP